MNDIEIAKKILVKDNLSLAIVKKGEIIFRSDATGIVGLLTAIERLGEKMHKSSVADRIVGKAAALLLAGSHVDFVYAEIMSNEGLKVLKENNVNLQYGRLVPFILNKHKNDICPYEKFSSLLSSPDEAFEMLRKFADNLNLFPIYDSPNG
ncbi:MAG: DUF1893 domain-containing protein [Nitrososphaerota archaeon]|nr:DUF1893 domain-containing protein [Candidatus Bathyarchaeota archaeon]MDW8049417.1 DUF1893 domain-containing protein [Nitrososphaerota archaeon]